MISITQKSSLETSILTNKKLSASYDVNNKMIYFSDIINKKEKVKVK